MPDVLLIDDDPTVHEMLAFVLRQDGLAVSQARTGVDALELLESDAPTCVVLDVALPGLDGFEVLTLMRARGLAPGAKVLVLSGRDDEAALVRAWELGATGYVLKPADPDTLLSRIRELIGTAAPAA